MSSEHSTVSAEELSSSSSPYIKSIRKRDISPSVVFAIDLLNHLLHHILFLYRASASSFGSSSLRDTWWPDVRGEVEYWLEEILERAAPTRVLTLLNSSPKSIFHICSQESSADCPGCWEGPPCEAQVPVVSLNAGIVGEEGVLGEWIQEYKIQESTRELWQWPLKTQ